MAADDANRTGPLVSVLIPTYNRRRYLSVALSSVVHQDYTNLEIFVIRDGGEDVADVVNSFNDERIVFINRSENRGLAFTLNQALQRARGKYMCYLGDDDLFYAHHVGTLVDALENCTDCQVAYSDLYKTYCRIESDGKRQILSKVVEISRDFDRFLMLYFNHALHVSLMHTRDLLEKIGPYNESLNVLIDWDLTRRLVFFSDFYHVHQITGEFYSPVGDSDRISVQRRKDEKEFNRNVLTIRTTRPRKPWTKIKDLSVIFVTDRFDRQAGETLGSIWRNTFYPYQVYLSLPAVDSARLKTDMPNLIVVPVGANASQAERTNAVLARCEGEYVAVVPRGFPVEEMWVEDPLYALINSTAAREGFYSACSSDQMWAGVFRKDDLLAARRGFPNLSLRESLVSAGLTIREPTFEELPFQFDHILHQAQLAEKDGDWVQAARLFEHIRQHYQNDLWMKTLAAQALFKTGDHKKADVLASQVNHQRPTVDTLLLAAKVKRETKQFGDAIELLGKAENILEGKELIWT